MRSPLSRRAAAAAAGAAFAIVAACTTTTGIGGGELARKGNIDQPVLFSWQSRDGGISGTMVATLPDATYRGPFFQITQQTERQTVTPLWAGWTEGWIDWPYWGWGLYEPYEWTQFATRYSGKVLANLATPAGRRMRCRLHLAKPVQGMSGGGDGECQLQDGSVIHARF